MADTSELSWWRRVGSPEDGFEYLRVNGKPLKSEAALAWIEEELVIPPGWNDVHISPDRSRRIHAWGRDDAGRKQYIYSEEHIAERDRRKWERVLAYARELPQMRAITNADLENRQLDKRTVLATMVRLISSAFFRVGGERYAERNKSFGISTLTKRHIEVVDHAMIFSYPGKRQKEQRRVVADEPLVEIVNALLDLEGDRLFQYRANGKACPLTAPDVNEYIAEVLEGDFTSKDLRTFGGTLRAATILADLGPAEDTKAAEKNVVLCGKLVATELGNTPAIARASYIHPAVVEEYVENGRTIDPLMRKEPRAVAAQEPLEYYPEEAALMRFLERYG